MLSIHRCLPLGPSLRAQEVAALLTHAHFEQLYEVLKHYLL